MSVLATIEIPADAFVLGDSLRENPGITVRLERLIPVDAVFVPYFWAADHSVEAIEAALRADEDVEGFELLDSIDDETLVRAEWRSDIDGFLDALVANDGTIQEGVGEADTWTFTIRFADHDQLSAFYRDCVDRGVTPDIRTVHNPGVLRTHGLGFELTEPQRDALMVALERGYYDVPRTANLGELAAELGVSATATKQRLSRGTAALLRATLVSTERERDIDTSSDGQTD